MSINRVVLSGNLTRDPEVRTTQGGTSVMNFGIAVNDRRRNSQTGEWSDYTNFFECVMFGGRAQGISQYIQKGSHVTIDGKLRYSQWERDGQRRSKVEVLVDDVDFKPNKDRPSGYSAPSTPVDASSSIYDEQIPF